MAPVAKPKAGKGFVGQECLIEPEKNRKHTYPSYQEI